MTRPNLTFQHEFAIRQYLRKMLPDSFGETNWDTAAWAGEVFWHTSLCLSSTKLPREEIEDVVNDWFHGRGPETTQQEFDRPDRILERVSYGVN